MKTKIQKILIAKDGYPLETVDKKLVLNFLRKILHGSHYECLKCYQNGAAAKRGNIQELTTPHENK